jgi:hypothetical protein
VNKKLELATGEKGALESSAQRMIQPLKLMFIDTAEGFDRTLLEANLEAMAKPVHKIYCSQLLERLGQFPKGMVNRSTELSTRVSYGKQLEGKVFQDPETGNLEKFRETDANRIIDVGLGAEMEDDLIIRLVEVRASAFEKIYFETLKEVALRSFAPKSTNVTNYNKVPPPAIQSNEGSKEVATTAKAGEAA